MSQEASGLITLLVLMAMTVALVVAAMVWLIRTDQKAGFDEDQARRDADELMADAANNVANRRRVRAGQCVVD
jgi:flagellin-like protein